MLADHLVSIVVLVLLWMTLTCAAGVAQTTTPAQVSSLSDRALVQLGDPVRLQRVFARASRGESITLGVIGGSITEGYVASDPSARYANLVLGWWQRRFPAAKFTLVNAGVGATGSNYGCLRVSRDLLAKRPDFVIVEFAVNDGNIEHSARTLEGLVRQILAQEQAPACMLLFMSRHDGSNAQSWHAQVGRHYGLPMVSYRDAIWPEIQAHRLNWTDLSPDQVHPNNRGHALAAEFVTACLDKHLALLPPGASRAALRPAAIPEPLCGDLFERTQLWEGADLRPTFCDGWTYDTTGRYWTSDRPGSTLQFRLPGRWLSVMFYRIHGPMGKVQVQVDGGNPNTFDAWFNETWGGYREVATIAEELGPEMHTITIKLLEERNPHGEAHEFRIMGMGAAGIQ